MSQAHEEATSCAEQSEAAAAAAPAAAPTRKPKRVGGNGKRHAGAKRVFEVQIDERAWNAAKERFRDANDKARKKKLQESIDKAQQFYEKDDVWAVRIPFEHMTQAEKTSLAQRLRPIGITVQLPIDSEYVGVAAVRSKKDQYNHSPDALGTFYFLAKCRADLVV